MATTFCRRSRVYSRSTSPAGTRSRARRGSRACESKSDMLTTPASRRQLLLVRPVRVLLVVSPDPLAFVEHRRRLQSSGRCSGSGGTMKSPSQSSVSRSSSSGDTFRDALHDPEQLDELLGSRIRAGNAARARRPCRRATAGCPSSSRTSDRTTAPSHLSSLSVNRSTSSSVSSQMGTNAGAHASCALR